MRRSNAGVYRTLRRTSLQAPPPPLQTVHCVRHPCRHRYDSDRRIVRLPPLPDSLFRPSHQKLYHGVNELKSIIRNFIAGSKSLVTAVRHSQSIKRRLRSDPSLMLDRASHRHLARTRVDTLGGLVIVTLFWIPILGNLVPIIVNFFPRQLPSVFVTEEMEFSLVTKDSQHRAKILTTLYERLLRVTHGTSEAVRVIQCRRPTDLLSSVSVFQSLSLDEYTRDELRRLLKYHGNFLLLHSLLPRQRLIATLTAWSARIDSDDSRLISEGYGERLSLRELIEACHERGIYTALQSINYSHYVELIVREKQGFVIDADAKELLAKRLVSLLKIELRLWLEMKERAKQQNTDLPVSLVSHTGAIVSGQDLLDYQSVIQ